MIATSQAYKDAAASVVRPQYQIRITFTVNGQEVVLTNEDLYMANLVRENNPISAYLPSTIFEFEVYNRWGIVSGDLIEKSDVLFEFGMDLIPEDPELPAVTEWVVGATLALTGEFSISNKNIQFKAVDKLNYLTDIYDKNQYLPYQTVTQVLTTMFDDIGIVNYQIDTALNNVYMTIPIKKDSVRNILQTIANANGCVIKVDATGTIIIEKNLLYGTSQAYTISFDDILNNYPTLTKLPLLNRLTLNVYGFNTDNRKVLYDSTFVSTDVINLRCDYEQSANILINTDATLIESITYSEYADLNMICDGSTLVQITGTPIMATKTPIIIENYTNGETLEHDNYLLEQDGDTIATWLNTWYNYRNQYEFEYRGSLELEPLDIVNLETLDEGTVSALVVRNEVNLLNSTGKIVARVVDNGYSV